jgi:small subunit ribosomal protein S7
MRKARPKKKLIKPDPRYGDIVITKFVNNIMLSGKKSVAFDIIYGAMDEIKKKLKDENELEIWRAALDNVMPSVEVKSRRIGGATFQIPTEINEGRRMALGMKWLITYSKKRPGKSMSERLAAEIIAAAKGEGAAVKKREDTHKMAEANKAFSHFKF